jgi:hypothetical protein
VPEHFRLGDPDHLGSFQIDSLYSHFLKRQSKGLQPFIILNSSPNHGKATKMSEKARGKKKTEYVEVDTDDPEVEEEKTGDDLLGETSQEDTDGADEDDRPPERKKKRKRSDLGNEGDEDGPVNQEAPRRKYGPPVKRTKLSKTDLGDVSQSPGNSKLSSAKQRPGKKSKTANSKGKPPKMVPFVSLPGSVSFQS